MATVNDFCCDDSDCGRVFRVIWRGSATDCDYDWALWLDCGSLNCGNTHVCIIVCQKRDVIEVLTVSYR